MTLALEEQLRKAIPNAAAVDMAEQNLEKGNQALKDALYKMIDTAVLTGVDIGREQVEYLMGVGKSSKALPNPDWEGVAGQAVGWVTGHVDNLMRELNHTSRKALRKAISQWKDTGQGSGALIGLLEQMGWGFDKRRGKMIAQTEITRGLNKGMVSAWKASGVVQAQQWQTAGDEKVCQVCAPLGGMIFDAAGNHIDESVAAQEQRAESVELGGAFIHPGGKGGAVTFRGQRFEMPAHVNCRCNLIPITLPPSQ